MVGNTYPYQAENFQKDILDAISTGIDGFALNLGQDEWTPARIQTFFDVAYAFPTFKLFFSFDMSIITSASVITHYVLRYAKHPNSFWFRGQYFVSTFAGESQTFGHKDVNTGWQIEVKQRLKENNVDICFVPSWTGVDAWDMYRRFPVVDGAFSWAAWYCDSLLMLITGHFRIKTLQGTMIVRMFKREGDWERFTWLASHHVSLHISHGRIGFTRTRNYS